MGRLVFTTEFDGADDSAVGQGEKALDFDGGMVIICVQSLTWIAIS